MNLLDYVFIEIHPSTFYNFLHWKLYTENLLNFSLCVLCTHKSMTQVNQHNGFYEKQQQQ